MFAIYKRELKSYFHSFIGFLFIAVTLFFISLYFTSYNLLGGYPHFAYAVASSSFMYLITVPILTMKVLADERKNKTDQLILTAPVSVGGIVMGKFLALVTIYAIPMAISCIYPLILTNYGRTPITENYIAILAFFLYGMTTIAIGLLISALTESQVIAAVLSFAVLFAGFMMNTICDTISSTGNLLTEILRCLDIYTPFLEMTGGTLEIGSVVYYVSVTALLLFLTVQSIQKRRYNVSVKNLSVGAYSTGMIAVVLAIVVVLNVIVEELPDSWKSVDLTINRLYSLTEQSEEYAKSIQEDVTIYVLVNEDNPDSVVQHTLQEFADASDHITVKYVDPAINPQFYTKYSTSYVATNSVIVESAKRFKVVNYSSFYPTVYSTEDGSSDVIGYDGEGQITSALDYVTSDDTAKIYMTTGHDELSLDDIFTSALAKENVEYTSLNLADCDAVPEDADCLFINAALNDFSSEEAEMVIEYLDRGGQVVLILGYNPEALPNIESIAAYMGLTVAEGTVIEQSENNYYNIPYYVLPNVALNEYTEEIFGNSYVFAPYAKGILIDDEDAEGMSYDTILYTSDSAFSKIGQDVMSDYSKSEGDIEGPFAIGVKAVKALDEGEALMMVYGSEQMFTDDASNVVNGANLTLFTNTISALVGREESVSIPVKIYDLSYVVIDQMTAMVLGAVTTIILPVACLLIGFVIWFRRRKR